MRKIEDRSEGKVSEGLTREGKLSLGYTNPELIIPPEIRYGKRRLTAKYLENKVYDASLKRTIVYYGTKVYIHCPTICIYRNTNTIILKANLYTNNHKVSSDNLQDEIDENVFKDKFVFKIDNKTVEGVTTCRDGTVEITISNYKFTKDVSYQCVYQGDVSSFISQARGEGRIVVVDGYNATAIKVDVTDIHCACTGEHTRLIARVHRLYYNTAVNKDDVITSGLVRFYVDGVLVGESTSFNSAGFVYLDYVANLDVGVHEIRCQYVPNTPELEKVYPSMCSSGTLFVGDDTGKPLIVQRSPHRGTHGSTSNLFYSSTSPLNGRVRVYLDNQLVGYLVNNGYNDSVDVTGSGFYLNLFVPVEPIASALWAYGGYHNFVLVYTHSVSDENSKTGVGYDVEYWYYNFDDFIIQMDTSVMIDCDEQDTGNLMIYYGKDVVDRHVDTVSYEQSRDDTNYVVSDKLKIKVLSIEENNTRVCEGKVRVKITPRLEKYNYYREKGLYNRN
ncbi:MAG: hypothetical protein BZ136_07545 [Methanosphaera sp. rholeuAM74]|nr:MAG: hypothetical protein BZ136_07545 [Methanosphaera sp. rholeuAM74]